MLIGAHCGGGVKGALDKAVEMGADAVQLFTQSPRAWKAPTPNPELYEAFRARREETAMGAVFCHAIYLVNLAAPNDEVYEKSVAVMRSTMDVASGIGADGVVFHVGSHLGSGFEHGLDRLRCLHVNDSKSALGSNSDRHDNILDGVMGEGLGAFLAHPKLQGLPVVLEVPGADNKGPNADELRKTRELHARWTKPQSRIR